MKDKTILDKAALAVKVAKHILPGAGQIEIRSQAIDLMPLDSKILTKMAARTAIRLKKPESKFAAIRVVDTEGKTIVSGTLCPGGKISTILTPGKESFKLFSRPIGKKKADEIQRGENVMLADGRLGEVSEVQAIQTDGEDSNIYNVDLPSGDQVLGLQDEEVTPVVIFPEQALEEITEESAGEEMGEMAEEEVGEITDEELTEEMEEIPGEGEDAEASYKKKGSDEVFASKQAAKDFMKKKKSDKKDKDYKTKKAEKDKKEKDKKKAEKDKKDKDYKTKKAEKDKKEKDKKKAEGKKKKYSAEDLDVKLSSLGYSEGQISSMSLFDADKIASEDVEIGDLPKYAAEKVALEVEDLKGKVSTAIQELEKFAGEKKENKLSTENAARVPEMVKAAGEQLKVMGAKVEALKTSAEDKANEKLATDLKEIHDKAKTSADETNTSFKNATKLWPSPGKVVDDTDYDEVIKQLAGDTSDENPGAQNAEFYTEQEQRSLETPKANYPTDDKDYDPVIAMLGGDVSDPDGAGDEFYVEQEGNRDLKKANIRLDGVKMQPVKTASAENELFAPMADVNGMISGPVQ